MNNEEFAYWGKALSYANYDYNTTRLNERAVEIPIARNWLEPEGLILELGNVLAHYPDTPERTVVDRWENAPGVMNMDIFDLTGEWEQIISISTVEHVRWDEEPREAGGSVAAIQHLRSLLSPNGRMMVTIPTGCNPPLDQWLLSGQTGTTRECTLIRDGANWRQTDQVEVHAYGQEAGWAESVWIGEWE